MHATICKQNTCVVLIIKSDIINKLTFVKTVSTKHVRMLKQQQMLPKGKNDFVFCTTKRKSVKQITNNVASPMIIIYMTKSVIINENKSRYKSAKMAMTRIGVPKQNIYNLHTYFHLRQYPNCVKPT